MGSKGSAPDKTAEIRACILDMLEDGKISGGERLPAARELASMTGVSFLKVQQAVETLAREGVLEIMPRLGAFVQDDWRERILPENLSIFNKQTRLPWLPGLLRILRKKMPQLRFTHEFPRGMLELKTTLHVQQNCEDYADLSPFLHECYPDATEFYAETFTPFFMRGKLVGIPFIFSPRVIYYNPILFRRAGCAMPEGGWEWEEFIDVLRRLRKILPPERIINWHYEPYMWMNFIMRAHGYLIGEPDANGLRRVGIDSEQTRLGLRCYREIGFEAGIPAPNHDDRFYEAFLSGEAAMCLSERQFLCHIRHHGYRDWATVPLPRLPGGVEITTQATDLLCVRKSCLRPSLAREYIRTMLSPEVQDYIGGECYGIPVRRSCALKSINADDPRDSLFLHEMGKISAAYNLDSPHLANLICQGIKRMLATGADIEQETARLAQTARTCIDIAEFCETHT